MEAVSGEEAGQEEQRCLAVVARSQMNHGRAVVPAQRRRRRRCLQAPGAPRAMDALTQVGLCLADIVEQMAELHGTYF